MVEAWPGYPDALAISNMLAEELGDESANARLLLLKPVRSSGPYEKEIRHGNRKERCRGAHAFMCHAGKFYKF